MLLYIYVVKCAYSAFLGLISSQEALLDGQALGGLDLCQFSLITLLRLDLHHSAFHM